MDLLLATQVIAITAEMYLHHSTTAMIRPLVCAASRQAALAGSLRSRCSPEGWTSPKHCQDVNTGLTLQCVRWYWWLGQQREFTKTSRRHHIPVGIISNNAAQCTTSSTISEQTYSTSKESGLASTSDTTEQDKKDFEALVELEIELYRQEGVTMPSTITPVQWQELLTHRSVGARKKYLIFLFKNEMKRENKRKLQQLKNKQREEELRLEKENPPQGDGHLEYGLWKNSIFVKILESTMNRFYHGRVVQAMLFGQPLVVDMGFEEHMSSRERQNCAYQVQMMMSENRKHQDPYNLELHNAPATLDTMVRLHRYLPTLYKPEWPININPSSYLEKYPKEQLVYLTPHCREEMSVYDHNAVYIIGGIVDRSSGEPLTLAKAKREGIHMQKLPLDRYLSWGQSARKSLTLNQVISILLDMKLTGDWNYAFRHIPSRKLKPPSQKWQPKEVEILKRIKFKERRFRNN